MYDYMLQQEKEGAKVMKNRRSRFRRAAKSGQTPEEGNGPGSHTPALFPGLLHCVRKDESDGSDTCGKG
jgi:hypothetical protein